MSHAEIILIIIGILALIITATVGRKSLREAIENSIHWIINSYRQIRLKTRIIYRHRRPTQSRAELIDIAEIIEETIDQTTKILKEQHKIINQLYNQPNNQLPVNPNLIIEQDKKIEEISKLSEKLYLKIGSIRERKWKGMETHPKLKKKI